MKPRLLQNIALINKLVLESRILKSEKEIIRRFVNIGRKLLNANYAYAFRWSNTKQWFEDAYVDSHTPYKPQIPRKNGLTSRTFGHSSPYFVEDTSKLKIVRVDAKRFMRAVVIIPITYKNERYGTIDICYNNKHVFNEEERVLCEYIGNNAAQAIIINRLHTNLQDFKNRMDKSLDPVFILHPSSLTIEYANMGAQRKFGFSAREFLKMTIFTLQPKSDKNDFKRKLMPLIFKRKDSLKIETILSSKNNDNIPAELFLQLSKSIDGSYKFLCTVHDLTEHKRAEKELQKIMRQKDEFFNIASHELKTPVTTIKGYAEMLEQVIKSDDDTVKKYLGKINSQTEKLTRLVNDLLDVSRIETGKMRFENESFELSDSIKHAVENLQVAMPHNKISFKSNGQFLVKGDCERIERVLTNLVNNASKYSPHGSKINICVGEKDGMAGVEVEDFGYGISIKDQSKIFKRFFQSKHIAKENLPGLGLGLYIASAIVKHHGGTVSFRNKPRARGAVFHFTLPYYKRLDSAQKHK